MKTYQTLIFCEPQLNIVKLFLILKLIKPVSAGEVYHPITNNREAFQQVYNAKPFVEKIMMFLVNISLNKEGKERIERLKHCGVISNE